MKKFLLVTLSLFLLVGCTPKQPADVETTIGESKNLEDVPGPGDKDYEGEEILEPIDWTQAKEEAEGFFTEVYDDVLYSKEFELKGDSDKKTLSIVATVQDDADPAAALEYANYILRQLNDTVLSEQEGSLEESSDDFYGGIYDEYSLKLTVAPAGSKDDSAKWFVNADIPAGSSYAPLELQPAYK